MIFQDILSAKAARHLTYKVRSNKKTLFCMLQWVQMKPTTPHPCLYSFYWQPPNLLVGKANRQIRRACLHTHEVVVHEKVSHNECQLPLVDDHRLETDPASVWSKLSLLQFSKTSPKTHFWWLFLFRFGIWFFHIFPQSSRRTNNTKNWYRKPPTTAAKPTCFLLPAPGIWYQALGGKNYLNFVFQRFKMGCPLHPFSPTWWQLYFSIFFCPCLHEDPSMAPFDHQSKRDLCGVYLSWIRPTPWWNWCTYTHPVKQFPVMRLCSCDDFALQFQAGNVTGFPLNFGGLSKERSEEKCGIFCGLTQVWQL